MAAVSNRRRPAKRRTVKCRLFGRGMTGQLVTYLAAARRVYGSRNGVEAS